MAARLPSWAWVSGLTVAATAAVVALAVQADHGPRPAAPAAHARPTASASPTPSALPTPSGPPALPEASGVGRRIVYSVYAHRVWLVDATGESSRTFTVWPGTVDPQPGRYTITARTEATTGSDGVRVEHIMYFTVASGVNIGFSNAVDGASPPPANGARTGGIRLHKEDGAALWSFGDLGTKVSVVK
ncbi:MULTISPECIES: hypothetical protein [unclassified Streptomyces]|nr:MULTISPECIES: hypothetical protein [unclassified Streptomyces]WUB88197.1 hypothetical protein OG812_17100 [Streptomyces sp. NBC_00566]